MVNLVQVSNPLILAPSRRIIPFSSITKSVGDAGATTVPLSRERGKGQLAPAFVLRFSVFYHCGCGSILSYIRTVLVAHHDISEVTI
jgi:hypothetical protein